jgi:hypothetical protein
MQLSISLPIPAATTPGLPQGAGPRKGIASDPEASGGQSQDSFSQMLPPPAPPKAAPAAQSKQGTAPSAAQEEAAATVAAGWLTATAPHQPPSSLPAGVAVSAKAAPAAQSKQGTAPSTAQQEAATAVAAGWPAATAPDQPPSSLPACFAVSAKAAPAAQSKQGTATSTALEEATAAVSGPALAPSASLQASAPKIVAPAVPVAAATLTAKPVPAAAAPVAPAPSRAVTAETQRSSADPTAPTETAAQAPVAAAAHPAAAVPAAHPVAAAAAKIAAPMQRDTVSSAPVSRAAVKRFLSSAGKEVTEPTEPLGTAVAKVTAAMPSTATAERPTGTQVGFLVPVSSASGPSGDAPRQAPQQPVAASAQGAVDAALKAAGTLANSGTARAVNLRFSVGNADLSLRVELKDGSVQATFATDSAQLRSDLSHEWRSTAQGDSQSSLNLAQPHFTSASGGDSAAGDSQQRGRAPSDPGPASAGPGSFGTEPADDEAQLVPMAPSSSQHLQTFA